MDGQKLGNPAVVGLAGFGMTTMMLQFHNLGWCGIAPVLWLGLERGSPLLAGFSLVGIMVGADMLRRRRIIPTQPRWWLEEHYGAMVGNAAATHIAFLAIGLPRLLPVLQGPTWFYLAWFGPVLMSIVAKVWLDRRHRIAAPARPARTARA